MNLTGRFVLALLSVSAVLLPACGGSDTAAPDTDERHSILTPPAETTAFFIRDLPSGMLQEPPRNSDQWSFAVRHQGSDIVSVQIPQSPHTIATTGLNLAQPIALHGNGRGSFFRSYYNHFESYIDSGSAPYRSVTGGGPHAAISYTFKSQPAAVGITLSVDISIPHFMRAGDGVAQLALFGYMTDGNDIIAFTFGVFDNRADDYPPVALHDTDVSFVSQPIHRDRYALPRPSQAMTMLPYAGYRSYGVTFTRESVKNILADINDFNHLHGFEPISQDAEAFRLILVGLLHEIALLENPDNVIQTGMSFKNFQAYRIR